MSDEEAFQAHLDAHPDDHTARLVFADWLGEQSDPREEGYRALGQLKRTPIPCDDSEAEPMPIISLRRHFYGDESEVNVQCGDSTDYVAEYERCLLPHEWFVKLAPWNVDKGKYRWVWIDTRRLCEHAAALAFAQLPAELRAKLLAQPVLA